MPSEYVVPSPSDVPSSLTYKTSLRSFSCLVIGHKVTFIGFHQCTCLYVVYRPSLHKKCGSSDVQTCNPMGELLPECGARFEIYHGCINSRIQLNHTKYTRWQTCVLYTTYIKYRNKPRGAWSRWQERLTVPLWLNFGHCSSSTKADTFQRCQGSLLHFSSYWQYLLLVQLQVIRYKASSVFSVRRPVKVQPHSGWCLAYT